MQLDSPDLVVSKNGIHVFFISICFLDDRLSFAQGFSGSKDAYHLLIKIFNLGFFQIFLKIALKRLIFKTQNKSNDFLPKLKNDVYITLHYNGFFSSFSKSLKTKIFPLPNLKTKLTNMHMICLFFQSNSGLSMLVMLIKNMQYFLEVKS